MFHSNNDNKRINLENFDEDLSDLSLGGSPLGLENDNNDLGLEGADPQHFASASTSLESPKSENICKKNRDKVIEPLSAVEVRWFYKSRVLQGFATKHWIELGGYDTIQLEAAFNKLPSHLQQCRNKDSPDEPMSPTSGAFIQNIENGNGNLQNLNFPKILVRGGLYEVDIVNRKGVSIYWPGEELVVLRGTWFYDAGWQPLDEDHAMVLEDAHLTLFNGKKPSDFPIASPAKELHSESLLDFHVDWYAPDEVYLYGQGTTSKIVRSFTQKLGGYFQKSTGYKLMRGYKTLASDTDKPVDISHLVFVVHGIGQKMNIGAQIFRNTTLIRERVQTLKQKYFPDCQQRVEFFPVEWRSNLTLDGGAVDAITPLHVKSLRQVLNTSAMDIMYYTSPIYCSEIQEGIVAEMNRLFTIFTEKNPNILPKVSVIAHSLGAVIVYDIITGYMPMSCLNDAVLVPGKSRLKFHLDNFICLGSPLSVFLAVRIPRGQHGYHLFPPSLCNRLYNIYHLTDPVAYRLEPLIVKDYARISPLVIHPHNAVRPVPYSEMPLEPLDPETAAPYGVPSASSKSDDPSTSSPTDTSNKGWSIWNLVRGSAKSSDNSGSPYHTDSPTQGLEHRLDYVLTSGAAGPLVVRSVLFSHTAYWSNYDVAFFVLTRIVPELEGRVVVTEDKPSTSTAAFLTSYR